MRLRRPLLALLLTLPSVALADLRDDARRHFGEGLQAAAGHDYRAAIDAFLAAYAAIPHPDTAFNLARSYEDLGELENALFWYRRFASMAPERAGEAEEPIRRTEAALAAAAAEQGSTPDALRARLTELEAERREVVEALTRQGAAPPTTAPVVVAPTVAPAATPAPVAATPSTPSTPSTTPPTTAPPSAAREGLLADPYGKEIVTASRFAQAPLDSPSSVTVISGDEIRQSGAVHVADVLRRAVGVDVMAMSSGTPYVGIRGFNTEMSNKVLWLVDGRPASLEFLATPFDFTLSVGLDEIDRIEIIRGPGSAIYGANAVSGVINLITRRPGEGPSVQATVGGGLNQLLLGSAVASGGKGPVTYRIGAGYQQEGRFSKALAALDPDGPVTGFLENQDLGDRRVRADARLDARFLDKGWASVSGGWSSGFSEFFSKAALGNFALQGTAGNVRADVAYGGFHLRSFWMREDGVTAPWLQSAGSVRSTYARVKDDVADVEAEYSLERKAGEAVHRLHVGAGYRFKQFRAGVPGEGFEVPRKEHHFRVFGQYTLQWRWLEAVASLRWDRHPLVDANASISPRGALVFRVAPKTSVRASAGTAFRAMNGLESYVNLDLNTAADGYFVRFTGAATDPAGRTLGPEKITTVELGAHDETSPFITVDGAVYWNRITALIDIGSVTPTLGPYDDESNGYPYGTSTWTNTDVTYDSVGGELDVHTFPADGLDVFANVSITKIWGTQGDTHFVDGSTALAHVNAGVQYRSPIRLDLSVTGHYVSEQRWRIPSFDSAGQIVVTEQDLPGRFLMSARLAGRPAIKPDLELALTLWNPLGFGQGFREHPNGQIVGPRLYGTATLAF